MHGVALLAAGAAAARWPTPRDAPLATAAGGLAPAGFDCAMRRLAYEYGRQLVPRLGAFDALYYALDLGSDDCRAELAPLAGASPAPAPPPPADAVYVSPGGDDAADGGAASPLRTVQRAADAAAARGGSRTVVLRGGVHYLRRQVVLTAAHSGLTLQAYPGERPVVSGGAPLRVTWEPYDVANATGAWVEEDGVNYVHGMPLDNRTCVLLGLTDSKEACLAACRAHAGCDAYTWHDAAQGAWARRCVARTDGAYARRAEAGHYSGHDDAARPAGGAPPAPRRNIWAADVRGQVPRPARGLQVDGVRATRARYLDLPAGIEALPHKPLRGRQARWTPPQLGRFGAATQYVDMSPEHTRNDSTYGYNNYRVGIAGLCSVYDPPVSYWCSNETRGGGAFAFRTPAGLTPDAGALPHAPYNSTDGAVVFVWHPKRWANWMFEVGGYDRATGNITFGRGGFQGARGNDVGGDWFIEGVMEELDYPGEFHHDAAAGKLYLFHNGTGAPPADAEVVVPTVQVLVNHSGTRWAPVRGVRHIGITYRAAADTYLEPHGVPSAGDWALDRFGALFFEGTEGAVVDNCTLERLDGNAVMVSGYNRNVTVRGTDFAFLGGNAVACWGRTNETEGDNHPAAGVDGTDGNHPRYTTVEGCTAREVGLYEKQSSFFVEAKTAQSVVTGNVFFNGPRAGINANDGFGGGDQISHNLVFSTCRESGDHGPFNSWDRQPYLTTVRTGRPSMIMAWREIHHNFFIDNYAPQEGVDNDDGSAYYDTHDNFFVYGHQGLKSDFGGHDNRQTGNVYAYVGRALWDAAAQLPGHEDWFAGNTLVMTSTDTGKPACSPTVGATVMHNNSYFTPNGTLTTCGMSLAAWQARGFEQGSTVAQTPSDAAIIAWGRAKLGIR